MADIAYGEVVATLLERIPELQSDYAIECAVWAPDKPHPHVIYGSLLPALIYRVEAAWRAQQLPQDEELLHRAFSLIEDLVDSSDFETRCVIEASFLETLLGKADGYEKFGKFLRPNTIDMARRVSERFSE